MSRVARGRMGHRSLLFVLLWIFATGRLGAQGGPEKGREAPPSGVTTSVAPMGAATASVTASTASTAPATVVSSVLSLPSVLLSTRPADPIPFPDSPMLTTLYGLLRSTEDERAQRREFQAELAGPEGEGRREPLLAEISKANSRIDSLNGKLEEVATGVERASLDARRKIRFDMAEELQVLVGPIMTELRELTERPREIERLRREVEYQKGQRAPLIEKALKNLQKLGRDLAQFPEGKAKTVLTTRLQQLHESWLERQREAANALAVAEHQLTERIGDDRPIWKRVDLRKSAHDLFALFFRSRGRNLLFASLVFFLVLLAFRWTHRRILRWSPWHRSGQRNFVVRLADVLYHVLTLLGACGAFLVLLYLYGDWVLLGLSLILIFGIIWAASKGLPRFWTQTQLLLNLGTVREGERVFYRDLPWRVASINIYSQLENPAIRGGKLRVHLEDLIELRSRPMDDGEPWFPSREGNWVLLADGTRGKVLVQTPEFVELVLLGGGRKIYPVGDYLSNSPLNLSRGFRVAFTFGLDYGLQEQITEAVPRVMLEHLKKALASEGKDEHLECLKVEFDTAGPSSLDLMIYADFRGDAAPSYEALRRSLSRMAVDACNANGWEIPFTQITLHQRVD